MVINYILEIPLDMEEFQDNNSNQIAIKHGPEPFHSCPPVQPFVSLICFDHEESIIYGRS
jgi:hypothetical protein